MRMRRIVLAASLILALLAVLEGYVFQAKPVLNFRAGRDAASLRAEAGSVTGEVKLVIAGIGKYTVNSITIRVTDYYINPLIPTTSLLDASASLPATFVLPSDWVISVSGPYSSGQTITVELQGSMWAFDAVPIPITLTATTRILWISQ